MANQDPKAPISEPSDQLAAKLLQILNSADQNSRFLLLCKPPHDFQPEFATWYPEIIYRCSKCNGWVTKLAGDWYNLGLRDASLPVSHLAAEGD